MRSSGPAQVPSCRPIMGLVAQAGNAPGRRYSQPHRCRWSNRRALLRQAINLRSPNGDPGDDGPAGRRDRFQRDMTSPTPPGGADRPVAGDPAARLEPSKRFRAGLSEHGIDLQDEVGRGAMSVVYRATDRRHARLVAIKVLEPAPTFGGDPDPPPARDPARRRASTPAHPSGLRVGRRRWHSRCSRASRLSGARRPRPPSPDDSWVRRCPCVSGALRFQTGSPRRSKRASRSTSPTVFRAPRASRRRSPRPDGRAAWADITLPDGAAAVSLGRGHPLSGAIADPAAWHGIAGHLRTFRGNAGCAIACGRYGS
jgi:hypothetical protein